MEEGTFDRQEPDLPNTQKQFAMAYSASMVQCLLVRIEHLELEVSVSASSDGQPGWCSIAGEG